MAGPAFYRPAKKSSIWPGTVSSPAGGCILTVRSSSRRTRRNVCSSASSSLLRRIAPATNAVFFPSGTACRISHARCCSGSPGRGRNEKQARFFTG